MRGATGLGGSAASLRFNKNSGEHWLWGGGTTFESPALDLNDAGILGGADGVSGWNYLTYRETKPGKFLREYSFDFSSFAEWNFEGIRTFGILDFFLNTMVKDFWNTSLH